MNRFSKLLLIATVALWCVPALLAGEKIGPRVSALLNAPQTRLTVWIFFADKGADGITRRIAPETLVSPASIRRRLNVLPPDAVTDFTDLPLNQPYVDQIASLGISIRQRSKWFNAVSAVASPAQVALVAALPFVTRVDLVSRFARRPALELPQPLPQQQPPPLEKGTGTPDYGPCLGQLSQINVPAVHATGNHAEGVIVGVFDNGVRLLSHQSFDSLRTRMVGMHDFVDHKTSVIPNNPSTGFGSHGVNTLSTIGGYWPGQQIGPAFGASFILARTENDSSETPIEEDNWVAAIEWADSLGVQVTSTSLGYLTFDSPYTSLTWQDMNGRTAIISLAATMAARKGIVVCNSAGNEGRDSTVNTLIAPADADSILTVGAVTSSGALASFSSNGPTVDHRTKPDVLAQGVGVHVASSTDTAGYGSSSGTSFSCPLTAGVAALLVAAHPHATPMEIINALRNTANNASSPNNFLGWGIVNAAAAVNALGTTDTGEPENRPAAYMLSQNYPNPFNPTTTLTFDVPEDATVTLTVYDLLGREVRMLLHETLPQGNYQATWNGTAANGSHVATGVYFARFEAANSSGDVHRIIRKMLLVR